MSPSISFYVELLLSLVSKALSPTHLASASNLVISKDATLTRLNQLANSVTIAMSSTKKQVSVNWMLRPLKNAVHQGLEMVLATSARLDSI